MSDGGDQNMMDYSEPSDQVWLEFMQQADDLRRIIQEEEIYQEVECIDLVQQENEVEFIDLVEVDDGEEVIDLTQEEVDVVEDVVENDEEEHEVEEQSEHLTQHVDCPKCFVLQDMLTGELQYDDSEHRNQHVDCLKCLEIN